MMTLSNKTLRKEEGRVRVPIQTNILRRMRIELGASTPALGIFLWKSRVTPHLGDQSPFRL